MTAIADILSAYRADREPVVASIQRIDSTIRALQPLAELTVDDLTRQRLAAHVADRLKVGVKPSTVRRELVTLRAAIRLAWKDRVIDRVPHIALPPRGQPRQRVLNADELARMRAAAADDIDDELLWALLVGTCGRLTALLELTWARAARRKHRAVVPIDRALVAVLRRASKRVDGEYVLPWRAGSTVQRHLHKIARRAAVPDLTPHVMRHTMATILLRKVPLVVASRMLGHKSVAITEQEYGHLLIDDLLPTARVVNGLLR